MSHRWIAGALGAFIVLGTAAPSHAGQGRWSANLAAGVTNGISDDFADTPGSISLAGGVYVATSPTFALGVRLGRHNIGTSTTIIRGLYGPGSVLREDYSQTVWEISMNACWRSALGPLRLGTSAGAGPYLFRTRNENVSRDSTGASMPQYYYLQRTSDLRVGFHFAVTLDRPRALGQWGIGVEGAFHQAAILVGDQFVTAALQVTWN